MRLQQNDLYLHNEQKMKILKGLKEIFGKPINNFIKKGNKIQAKIQERNYANATFKSNLVERKVKRDQRNSANMIEGDLREMNVISDKTFHKI